MTSLDAPGPTSVPPEARLETALAESGYPVALGTGVAAAMKGFQDSLAISCQRSAVGQGTAERGVRAQR